MNDKTLRSRLLAAWVTAGGLGYAPFAKGTFGTLAGIAIAALIGYGAPEHYLWLTLAAAAVAAVGGALAGKWAERRYGRKDPGEFVMDEVAGYLITVAWPVFPGWTHLFVGFFFFRAFDNIKPFPCRRLEKVPGGWGIVLDDLMAGVYSLIVVMACRYFFADQWPV
jgi:phosphatidylglycerophosphatase A